MGLAIFAFKKAQPFKTVTGIILKAKEAGISATDSDGGIPMAEENIVFVGKKGTMAYVLAVVTQLNQGAKTVTLKARGKAISRAVDVAEIVKNKFMQQVKLGGIDISTEEIATDEGTPLKVSAIEITLNK